jgi:hypothetical protein
MAGSGTPSRVWRQADDRTGKIGCDHRLDGAIERARQEAVHIGDAPAAATESVHQSGDGLLESS